MDSAQSILWVQNRKGGRARPSSGHDSYLSVSSSKANGTGKNYIVFTLYKPLIKELRWLSGDRVNIGFDVHGMVYIVRAQHGAYSLSPSSKGKSHNGKIVSCIVRFTQPENIDVKPVSFTPFAREDVAISDDGVLSFAYPDS